MPKRKEDQKYELEYMNRQEAEKALKEYGKAILPLGATEQHGFHLPLGTDTFIAHELSKRLAHRIGALVLPTIPIGYSWVWRDIPGTLILPVDVVKQIVKDTALSLARHGLKQYIIINGHDANGSAIKYAVRELADVVDLEAYYFTYASLKGATDFMESPKWDGMVHACEVETSLMLAIRPELCNMERAVREYPKERKSYRYHHSSLPMGALSKSGVFGDATLATAEKGEAMIEAVVERMVEILNGGGERSQD